MICDLLEADGPAHDSADVCIVGSGVAGLMLAARLRDHGLRVVIIESGGRDEPDHTASINEVVHLGIPYRGATAGRARRLGGTSTIWGGALIPFLPEDLLARPYLGLDGWPVSWTELQPYIAHVESLCRVDDGPFDDAFVAWIGAQREVPHDDPEFLARFAKLATFRRRNLATLFQHRLKHDPDLRVWMNATVREFTLTPDRSRIASIVAVHPGGRRITVAASRFVLCAGAIESTRLLLWLDRCCGVFRGCAALGRYFFDHVSTHAANVHPKQVHRLNRLAAQRFVGSTVRSLRYELSPAAQRESRVASAFAIFAVRTDKPSGFDVVRAFLQAIQKTGRADPALIGQLVQNVPYLIRLAAWRFVYRQLFWPQPAHYDLHACIEQLPFERNRIALADETDVLGMPRAAIEWNIYQPERDALAAFMRRFDSFWKRHGLDRVADLAWCFDIEQPEFDLSRPYDTYHPGGTTRMGVDAASAVVDSNLKTFALDNLFVASTSVFPTGASSNPTFMLMLFALRLADHLAAAGAPPSPAIPARPRG